MTYRLRNIVLAVGLAALAALLTSFYVANYKKSVQQDEASVTVYVASQKITAGTPGSEVLSGNLYRAEKVARRTVVPGAISDPKQVDDLVAAETVYQGEQLSVQRFKPVEAAGIRAELRGNLRAVQVNGDSHQMLAGTSSARSSGTRTAASAASSCATCSSCAGPPPTRRRRSWPPATAT